MGVKDGSGLYPSSGRVRICLLSAQGSWFGVYLLNSDPVRVNVNIYSTMTGVRRQSKSGTAQAHSIPGTQVNINHILHLHVSLFDCNSLSNSSSELSPKPESEWMSLCF